MTAAAVTAPAVVANPAAPTSLPAAVPAVPMPETAPTASEARRSLSMLFEGPYQHFDQSYDPFEQDKSSNSSVITEGEGGCFDTSGATFWELLMSLYLPVFLLWFRRSTFGGLNLIRSLILGHCLRLVFTSTASSAPSQSSSWAMELPDNAFTQWIHQYLNVWKTNKTNSPYAWPPPALTALAILTIVALVVHPDGLTWIMLRKIRNSMMTIIHSSTSCWAVMIKDYGILSTLAALTTFALLASLIIIVHKTLSPRSPGKQKRPVPEKKKKKRKGHQTRGRGSRIKSVRKQESKGEADPLSQNDNIDLDNLTTDANDPEPDPDPDPQTEPELSVNVSSEDPQPEQDPRSETQEEPTSNEQLQTEPHSEQKPVEPEQPQLQHQGRPQRQRQSHPHSHVRDYHQEQQHEHQHQHHHQQKQLQHHRQHQQKQHQQYPNQQFSHHQHHQNQNQNRYQHQRQLPRQNKQQYKQHQKCKQKQKHQPHMQLPDPRFDRSTQQANNTATSSTASPTQAEFTTENNRLRLPSVSTLDTSIASDEWSCDSVSVVSAQSFASARPTEKNRKNGKARNNRNSRPNNRKGKKFNKDVPVTALQPQVPSRWDSLKPSRYPRRTGYNQARRGSNSGSANGAGTNADRKVVNSTSVSPSPVSPTPVSPSDAASAPVPVCANAPTTVPAPVPAAVPVPSTRPSVHPVSPTRSSHSKPVQPFSPMTQSLFSCEVGASEWSPPLLPINTQQLFPDQRKVPNNQHSLATSNPPPGLGPSTGEVAPNFANPLPCSSWSNYSTLDTVDRKPTLWESRPPAKVPIRAPPGLAPPTTPAFESTMPPTSSMQTTHNMMNPGSMLFSATATGTTAGSSISAGNCGGNGSLRASSSIKENPFDQEEDCRIEAQLQELGGQMVGSVLDF